MTRPCQVPGCAAMRGSRTFSPYCQAHRATLRRHGHPEQAAVTLRHLAPYMATVRATMRANPDADFWTILRQRWDLMLSFARAAVAERESGRAHNGTEAKAGDLLLKVAAVVEFEKAAEVLLAVVIFEDRHRSAIKSDKALRFLLVRRLRHLAPMSKGSWYSNKTKRVHKVYRDLAPKVVEVIGAWLLEVFGLAGRLVAAEHDRLNRSTPEVQARQRDRLAEAVADLARPPRRIRR